MTAVWDDERVRFLRYATLERWPSFERMPVPGGLRAELLAAMLRCTVAEVAELDAGLALARDELVTSMLTSPDYRRAVAALPFPAGSRVVALGDSLTADRVGWFELIDTSLRQCGRDDVELHNLGVSGDTTADAIERFDVLEARRPTHVLLWLGTNDARTHGRQHGVRMVSLAETRRNLLALRDLVTGELGARLHFITPPPGERADMATFFVDQPLRWDPASLDDLADLVRELDPNCVDVAARMRRRGLDGLFEPDGVHLAPLGQRFVAETVVRQLAAA